MKNFLAETQCSPFNQKIVLNKRLLCSFSGGQDSSVVFFTLLHRKITSQNLIIIYCHHFWQPHNFKASVSIFQLSFALKIPYALILPNTSLLNENRSRDWRKKALSRFSHIEHPSILITGHTQTDRLETNLNKLFRGTSPKGFRNVSSQNYKTPIIFFFSPMLSFFSFPLTQSTQLFNLEKNGYKFKVFFTSLNRFSKTQNSNLLITNFLKVYNRTHKNSNRYRKYDLKSKKTILNSSHKLRLWDGGSQKERSSRKLKNFLSQTSLWGWREEPFFTQKSILTQKKSNQVVVSKFWAWKNAEARPLENNEKILVSLAPFIPKTVFLGSQTFFIKEKNLNRLSQKRMFWDMRNKKKNSISFCFYSCSMDLKLYQEKPVENETRQTISKLAKIYDLPVFQDITNFSVHSSRNKIRHILFPLLGFSFQKKVNLALSNFFEILKQENYQIDNLFRNFYFLFDFFLLSFNNNDIEFFDKFLWMFFYNKSEFSLQPQIFKKSVENFSERDLLFEHLFNIKKTILIESQIEN